MWKVKVKKVIMIREITLASLLTDVIAMDSLF